MTPEMLLASYWDGCLPVDVLSIARKAGLHVATVAGEGVEAAFYDKLSGCVQLTVGVEGVPARTRWSVAHVMGRVYGGCSLPFATKLSDYAHDNKDTACYNRYAAALLMPEKTLMYVVSKGTTDVDKLAKMFGVSSVAMAYRLSQLMLKEGQA